MGNPMLNSCCFCCSVRTGSLVIGFLNAIGGFVRVILGICFMALAASTISEYVHHAGSYEYNVSYEYDVSYFHPLDTLGRTLIGISIFLDLINLVLSCFMISGVLGDRSGYIIPWVIYHYILSIINGIIIFILTCVCFSLINASAGFAMLIVGGSIIGINIYLIMVVHSAYRNLTSRVMYGHFTNLHPADDDRSLKLLL